jgi:hypothetical protein
MLRRFAIWRPRRVQRTAADRDSSTEKNFFEIRQKGSRCVLAGLPLQSVFSSKTCKNRFASFRGWISFYQGSKEAPRRALCGRAKISKIRPAVRKIWPFLAKRENFLYEEYFLPGTLASPSSRGRLGPRGLSLGSRCERSLRSRALLPPRGLSLGSRCRRSLRSRGESSPRRLVRGSTRNVSRGLRSGFPRLASAFSGRGQAAQRFPGRFGGLEGAVRDFAQTLAETRPVGSIYEGRWFVAWQGVLLVREGLARPARLPLAARFESLALPRGKKGLSGWWLGGCSGRLSRLTSLTGARPRVASERFGEALSVSLVAGTRPRVRGNRFDRVLSVSLVTGTSPRVAS